MYLNNKPTSLSFRKSTPSAPIFRRYDRRFKLDGINNDPTRSCAGSYRYNKAPRARPPHPTIRYAGAIAGQCLTQRPTFSIHRSRGRLASGGGLNCTKSAPRERSITANE